MSEDALLTRHLTTTDPQATRDLGARLGASAEAGDLFLLEGEFGSGKTVLVQGLASGLGVVTYVASPSFVLVNQHQGRLPLYHVDLFRIERLDPELEATLVDIIEAGGVVAIEWPRLLPDDLRRGAAVIRFAHGESDVRVIDLETCHLRIAQAAGGRRSAAGASAGCRPSSL